MNRFGWLLVFGAVCAVQIAVPVEMISRHERALDEGEVFRFRCSPVDPVDVFRGRYVSLFFDEAQVSNPAGERFVRGQTIYAVVEEGDQGFARVIDTLTDRPASGTYIRCRVQWANDGEIVLAFPFDRYYMEETAAPEAEALYRKHVRSGARDAWVTVRVQNGYAALEELFIDGTPIRELLSET